MDSSTRKRPTICVGMATYDDFDGVWFTIQAIQLYQSEVLEDVSFVVVDNNPAGPFGPALKALGASVERYHYVPFEGYRSTAIRDFIFRETDADVVCCIDSHILLQPGALAALQEWFTAHPMSGDMLQGALLHDDVSSVAGTHFQAEWGAGMYGRWAIDPRIDDASGVPFEIPMQGLGFFACRREAWPGLNPRFRGFGGEEGYLHEKVRQGGGKVLCHPELTWLHRFARPAGAGYVISWDDRIRNYLIGWREIGWDTAPIDAHFRELLPEAAEEILERTEHQLSHPTIAFDALFWLGSADHVHPSEIAWRVENIGVEAGLKDAEARLVAWREAVRVAAGRDYASVLIATEPGFPAREVTPPTESVARDDWDLWVTTGAIGVSRRAYERLLDEIPADGAARKRFIERFGGIRAYLIEQVAAGAFSALGTGGG